MNRIPAPKCRHEGCQRTTHRFYCFDHQQQPAGAAPSTDKAPLLKEQPQSPAPNFARYTNTPELWSDLLGAFPDIGDVVHPHTIRQEALGTLRAAVDAEVYRAFPSLNVANGDEREALVEKERERIISELLPGVTNVSGAEARELSHSSADIFGRSTEDSKYLASYALNAEWECGRILNGTASGENSSLDQFIATVSPQMRDTIDVAFRRNLGDFESIILETTGSAPLNSDPIAPHLAIAPPPQAPPAAATQQDSANNAEFAEQAAYVSNWFSEQRAAQSAPEPQPQPQPQQGYRPQPQENFQYPVQPTGQQEEPAPLLSIIRKGFKALDAYVMDEDGSREAARIVAKKKREEEARAARRNRAEEVDLQLKEELLKQRRIRNNRSSGWW